MKEKKKKKEWTTDVEAGGACLLPSLLRPNPRLLSLLSSLLLLSPLPPPQSIPKSDRVAGNQRELENDNRILVTAIIRNVYFINAFSMSTYS